jgi:hypothetical protein
MEKPKKILPVKLFFGVTITEKMDWPSGKQILTNLYGGIDHSLDWYLFDHTEYYKTEMGENLKKCMVSLTELIMPEKLVEIKIASNEIEKQFMLNGSRKINLDPGYLTSAKIILATTKDYSHRVYLGRGIFADLHLQYRQNKFQINPWTYPDYQEPFVIKYFEELREIYLHQLRNY